MKMRKQVKSLAALFLISALLDSCHDCKNGVVFVPDLWTTWKLTKIVSSSKTITNFPYQEYLKISLISDSHGNAVTQEKILRSDLSTGDTVLIATNGWTGYGADCKNTSVSVLYDTHLQRKYWLTNRGGGLEATGYVNQIGDKSDTTKYFYQPQ